MICSITFLDVLVIGRREAFGCRLHLVGQHDDGLLDLLRLFARVTEHVLVKIVQLTGADFLGFFIKIFDQLGAVVLDDGLADLVRQFQRLGLFQAGAMWAMIILALSRGVSWAWGFS